MFINLKQKDYMFTENFQSSYTNNIFLHMIMMMSDETLFKISPY